MADAEILEEVSVFNLEYRNDDDAWYSCRVVSCEGNADVEASLTVKFQGFTEASDVKYTVGQFQKVAEVDEFVKRFRPPSEQLQDRECQKVTEGIKVCAALSCQDDDLRFFDAVVEAVNRELHVFSNGEEECMCTFILFWLHGPSLGNLTAVGVGNICSLRTEAQVDPDISSFAKLAMQRIEIASCQCPIARQPHASGSGGPADCEESCLSYNVKSSLESRCRGNGTANGSVVEVQIGGFSCIGTARRYNEQSDCDEDLGGNDVIQSYGLHFVLIDNLEGDLSPRTISQFIYEHTSIFPEAYVFPSRSSVPHASGVIILDSEVKLAEIFDFLFNPEHIIISARGRPWIVTEKMVRHGTCGSAARFLSLEYQGEFRNSNSIRDLQVVHLGTEAYKRATQLRELFMEYLDHDNRVLKRLALEESRILQSS